MGNNDFRPDLYYRLNVFPVFLPPLRERREDIPLLTWYFLEKYTKRMQKSVLKIDAGTMGRLMGYPWPGNIRELESVIERAVILSQGTELRVEDQLLPLLDMSKQQMNSPAVMGQLSHKVRRRKKRASSGRGAWASGNQSKGGDFGIGRTVRKTESQAASCETDEPNETLKSVS
jgi:transcriptional regulator with PAS, ATPase and Fis domain